VVVPRTKPGHRHVLLPEVGVDRRFARYRSGQVLNGARIGLRHGPIRFADAHLFDIQFFVGGAVGEDQLAERLDSGVALNLDAEGLFALPGSVLLEPVGGRHLLDNIRFLRIIGLFLIGRLRFLRGRRLLGLRGDGAIELERRRDEKQGNEGGFSEMAHRFYTPVMWFSVRH
jgi:hypothetical protein